jgi:hypothetical protein
MKSRMLRNSIGTVAVLLTLTNRIDASAAAAECYRATEIEAEQAVRYQTELMVVSDTCKVETYRQFTVRNRDVIVIYQKEMIEHFRHTGKGRAEATFDSFQTRIANEVSLEKGRQPIAILCKNAADFLAKADALDKLKFRSYVTGLAAERRATYHPCPN